LPKITFDGGLLHVGSFHLDAPLAAGGQNKLFTSVSTLTHDQLEVIAVELGLPVHGLVETLPLLLVVAGELQLAWFVELGSVPPNVALNHEARLKDYRNKVADLKLKGATMATKAKATRAVKKSKEVASKKSVTYSVLKSKVAESKLAKKVEDEKVTSHVPLVAQVLLGKSDRAWTLADVLDAVKATKRYSTKSGGAPTEANVRGDLNLLEKEGLVKVVEAA
jgi:hypothetical protein